MIIPQKNNRKISAYAQLCRLKHDFPESEGRMLSSRSFVWTYTVQPQTYSDFYNIEIRYNDSWSYPKVFVKTKLSLYPGAQELPHVFNHQKQQICLNYDREWNKSLPISTYYVPWASEWLFYYESWVITGDWLGGGIHGKQRYE